MGVKRTTRDGTTMDAMLRAALLLQFGAAIDMLDDALTLCPDELGTSTVWKDPQDAKFGQYWFIATIRCAGSITM